MALSFKSLSVFLVIAPLVSSAAPKSQVKMPKALQADICELLTERSTQDNSMRFPNEFYDCHAHGRYEKSASLEAPAGRPFPG